MKSFSGGFMESIRVLLVEDNPDDEYLATWVLKKGGIGTVSVARDGREALDMLFGEGAGSDLIPDLVILDLRLPKIDGKEVLGRIRGDSRTRNLPVLILTSSEDTGDKDSCRKLGIIDYCSKPLREEDIRKALNSIGRG